MNEKVFYLKTLGSPEKKITSHLHMSSRIKLTKVKEKDKILKETLGKCHIIYRELRSVIS